MLDARAGAVEHHWQATHIAIAMLFELLIGTAERKELPWVSSPSPEHSVTPWVSTCHHDLIVMLFNPICSGLPSQLAMAIHVGTMYV